MASYTIPEEIIGVPLFVPDAHDFFSIGAGEMPNGDDCLVVHGDVSPDYKAFQVAPVLSPNIFYDRTYNTVLNNMSIVFWLKCSPITFSGSGYNQSIMFAPMQYTAAPSSITDPEWMRSVGGSGANWVVHSGVSGANQPTIYKRSASSGGGASADFSWWTSDIPTDTWTQIVMTPGTDVDSGLWVNDEAVRRASWTASGDGTFATLTVPNQFFTIGSFSDHPNLQGRADEWRIGKLSFHAGKLNLTQRSLLYNAMMFGP
jgi:hypothetical protein